MSPTMAECVSAAADMPELVREFDRLTGHNLSRRGAPIDLMVDEASGRTDAGCAEFLAFVYRCVFLPMQVAP